MSANLSAEDKTRSIRHPPMAMTRTPVNYYDRAMAAVRSLGLLRQEEGNQAAVELVMSLSRLDETRAVAIARVLQQSSRFNEIVRDELTSMQVSDRYAGIIKDFDSIRDDARRMVSQAEDGRIDWHERLQNTWMTLSRGDITARFGKIRSAFQEVSRDAANQINREASILGMYADFRLALKDAEIQAHELLQLQSLKLEQARRKLANAQLEVEQATQDDMAIYARLAMSRDEALRAVQEEDERYQVAKDLADNLQVAYATSESVMARVQQSHQVKRRVNMRSITFFSTNETVLTALNASFITQLGLHESTRTLNAMVEGINQGVETVADVGDQLLKEGLQAGYGSTISVDSVRRLVDSVVNFQQSVSADIEDLRENATRDATDISAYVEQGKRRYAALIKPAA